MRHGHTPLTIACSRNYVSIVSLLVKFDQIDVNLSDIGGESPLHFAIQRLNSQIVELLVSSGADCNQQDKNGNTSLHNLLTKFKKEKVEITFLKQIDSFKSNLRCVFF